MEFLKDLWGFLKQRKKFWLLPMIVILLSFGAIMAFAAVPLSRRSSIHCSRHV